MKTPLLLLAFSLAATAGTRAFPGALSDGLLALGVVVSLAAAILVLLPSRPKPRRARTALKVRRLRPQHRPILIDGSNVMHWAGGTPDLRSVRQVILSVQRQGYTPVVWFDANAGYLVENRYMQPGHLATQIGLPTRAVHIAPRGTQADPLILQDARRLKARVITNDRFRDWHADFPEIQTPGFLVPGRIDGVTPQLSV